MGSNISLNDGGPLPADAHPSQPYIESAIYKFQPLKVPNRPKNCLVSTEIKNALGTWRIIAMRNAVSGKLAVMIIMIQGKIALYDYKVVIIKNKAEKTVKDSGLLNPMWLSNTLHFDSISINDERDLKSYTFTLGVKEIITELPISPIDNSKKSRFVIKNNELEQEEHLYNFATHFYDDLGFCWQLKYKNANQQLHFFVNLVNGVYNEDYDISFKLYHKWMFLLNKKITYRCTPKSSSERISDSFIELKQLPKYLQNKNNLNFRIKVHKCGKGQNLFDKIANEYVLNNFTSKIFVIENYSEKKTNNDHFESSLFTDEIGNQWRLIVYLNGEGSAKKMFLSAFLFLDSGKGGIYEYMIEILNQNPNKIMTNLEKSEWRKGEIHGFQKFILSQKLMDEECVKNANKLVFRCAIRPHRK